MKGFEEKLDVLKAGDRVGVTCSPKQGLQVALDTAAKLSDRGFSLTPHLAARRVKNKQHLKDIVSQLTDSNITSIFVPGGDLDEPMGEYDSSAAVLQDWLRWITRLRVLALLLIQKATRLSRTISYSRRSPLNKASPTHMVTQMCLATCLCSLVALGDA